MYIRPDNNYSYHLLIFEQKHCNHLHSYSSDWHLSVVFRADIPAFSAVFPLPPAPVFLSVYHSIKGLLSHLHLFPI